jgi:putative transposase
VLGAPWQRCTVRLLRDCLGHARKDQHGLLAALIRPIFNAENLAGALDKLSEAVAALEGKLPKVATVLEAAEDDILAFAFPTDQWRKRRTANTQLRVRRPRARLLPLDRRAAVARRPAGRPRRSPTLAAAVA